MARITDNDNWFDVWMCDKKSMIECMTRNMAADLKAGYDFFGKSIQDQIAMINNYKCEFENELDAFKKMTDAEVNRWCFYDMKKRGVIA